MFSTFMKKTALLGAMVALLAIAASAQVTQIEGTVKVKLADGTLKPVPGAQVDMYRTDIAGKFTVKADKNGHYIRLGLPVQGIFTFVFSGPECQPTWITGIHIAQAPSVDIVLSPGDGSVMTYEQVVASMKGNGGSTTSTPPAPSAADKAKADAATKERAAKNKELMELQGTLDESIKHFKQGTDLQAAKNYQGALTEFEQAAVIDPSKHKAFAEVAYKSNAQVAETSYQIGAEMFNNKQKTEAKPLFEKAYQASKKAIDIASTVTVADDPNINNELITYYGLLSKNGSLLVELYGDTDIIDDMLKNVDKASALDQPTNKAKWTLVKAKMYFNTGKSDEAIAAYKEALQSDPNNADALFGIGLALVATGDKAKMQEGVNYLSDFVNKAPATDKRIADVKSQIDALKQQQVEPEKPAKRRKP